MRLRSRLSSGCGVPIALLFCAASLQAQPDSFRIVGPRVFARGPLWLAVSIAFKAKPGRLIMPDWFRTTWADIPASSVDELRDKLIERYSLSWHQEQRILNVWVVRGRPKSSVPPPDAPGPYRGMKASRSSTWSQVICEPCRLTWVIDTVSKMLEVPVIDETEPGTSKAWFDAMWKSGDDDDLARQLSEKSGFRWAREQRVMEVTVIDSAIDPEHPPEPVRRFACDAATGIRSAIDALPSMENWVLTLAERMAPRRALMREHPMDVFAQMAAQDAFRRSPQVSEEWGRALAAYAAIDHPFLGQFLEARLRVALYRTRSRQLLESVLRQAPDFPWAHLALVEWAEIHAPSDTYFIERHVSEFTALCPGSFAVLRHVSGVRDRALLGKILDSLTPTLMWSTTVEAMQVLPVAWRIRLQIAEDRAAALAQVRDRGIAVARFRPRRLEWAKALIAGYKLVGEDAETRRWVEDVVLQVWPASAPAYEIARERGGNWQERLPDLPQWAFERWRAASASPRTSPEELMAAADAYLETASDHPDLASDVPPPPIEVAEAYRRRGVRLDRIRPLIEQGIALIEKQEKYRRESDVTAQFDVAERNVAETYRRAAAVLGPRK